MREALRRRRRRRRRRRKRTGEGDNDECSCAPELDDSVQGDQRQLVISTV
jgi:hypothetical protein